MKTPKHSLRKIVSILNNPVAGFNGVRKHQKIEDPRYLYWADRLGLLVWQDMPSGDKAARWRGPSRASWKARMAALICAAVAPGWRAA